MLLVRFQLGDTQLAIEASQIIEILPFISMPKVLRAPVGIAGAINYHGELVPVIDLSELVLGQSTRAQLSTRIIVTEFHEDNDTPCRLGLVAGNATETIRCEPADFLSPGIVPEDAPYLGSIVVGSRGQVQRIKLNKLLPQSLRYALSKQRAAG